jgi:hypothetical protein
MTFVAPCHSFMLERTPKPRANEFRAWHKDEYGTERGTRTGLQSVAVALEACKDLVPNGRVAAANPGAALSLRPDTGSPQSFRPALGRQPRLTLP